MSFFVSSSWSRKPFLLTIYDVEHGGSGKHIKHIEHAKHIEHIKEIEHVKPTMHLAMLSTAPIPVLASSSSSRIAGRSFCLPGITILQKAEDL